MGRIKLHKIVGNSLVSLENVFEWNGLELVAFLEL